MTNIEGSELDKPGGCMLVDGRLVSVSDGRFDGMKLDRADDTGGFKLGSLDGAELLKVLLSIGSGFTGDPEGEPEGAVGLSTG